MTERENRPDAGNIEPAQDTHATNGADEQVTPQGYPSAQLLYRDAGWRGVLPLPPRSKAAPPSGYTGRDGQWPSEEQFDTWAQMYPHDANICLRLDDETVGIDVDAYGNKTGAETLDEAETRWGTLPPTLMSSSRDDGVSGIRLFRVPPGIVLRDRIRFKDVGGLLGIGDIEILQHHHRYVVCWPSAHPDTKTRYVWRDADGAVYHHIPVLADLPALPPAWLNALRREEKSPDAAANSGVPYDVTDAATGGRPSPKVAQRLAVALYDVEQGHSRHDTTRDHVLALLRFGSEGHEGTAYALEKLFAAFVAAVACDRQGGIAEAEEEFVRFVTGASALLSDPPTPGTVRDTSGSCRERAVSTSTTPPTDTPLVDGDALMTELLDTLRRYVCFPDDNCAVAVALWVAATHAIEAWNSAPRLVLNSPQKRCGKSRALDVISGMCHQPLVTVNASVSAVFRSLYGDRPPTLIIDEADTIFGSKRSAESSEDLRGLLNAGHQRNRPALRCVGPQLVPTEFPTFAMVALAGIGAMPDTITDRAINITMRRRTSSERVAQFRCRRDEPVLHRLRDRLAVWAQAHIDELADAVPDMPVEDRAADTWEPLVAVADTAGGHWPVAARSACLAMVKGADDVEQSRSLDIKLLGDIRQIFAAKSVSFLSSTDLVNALKVIPESPWRDFDYTASKVAHHLAPYGVKPGHSVDKKARGYRLDWFHDAFERYLRPDPSDPSETGNDQAR